ncbi:MAG TPA: bifunctional UDP-N-acetylglucosamine diphosphorylase/glucosamine-1-phosphate N-acetyltransferase GlmU [Methylophilaceae bacterium]|nr:bifunctional UDP-N-acetylglucosamine diphosphorylase/glucosamine-1-phosphate N-acetyltransferase GlmU [Methylophilaceae bacterium]
MENKKLNIIILAAGKGTRMHSNQPKVLHTIGGKPILGHVIECALNLNPEKIIVVHGYEGDKVKAAFQQLPIIWAEQKEQLGTGHAVQQALPYIDSASTTLILLGDVPLVSMDACQRLIENAQQQLVIQSFIKQDPTGYGRIVRDPKGLLTAIVEHKDATSAQLAITEVNTGIMAMPADYLAQWLGRLTNDNAQNEYYLTDIVKLAVEDHTPVNAEIADDEWTVTGINSKQDLAVIERELQKRQANQLLEQGVTLLDPTRIDIRGKIEVARDVEIDIGCIFEGEVRLEEDVKIGAYCILRNVRVSSGTTIAPFSHIDEATIGKNSKIGPYARIRPGTRLGDQTHIGNFVELKNAEIDTGSKVNHLSYIGDATLGKKVNIGAGTITCNYDGANKFRTIIEDDAFIGSDSQLVAPVTVGKGSTIAAGSTITKDTPENALTLCRAREQKSIDGWKRPTKSKKE